MEKYDKFRTMIHPYMLKGMELVKGKNHKVIGKMPKGNCLVVCNHECMDDVPAAGMTVQDHTYLLISDEDKNTLTGFAVTLNGAIWVNRHDKENRHKSEQKVKEILAHGKNVMMYPEATWNLSKNDLMLNMNYGCIRIALESDVPIVPVVSRFEDGKIVSVIGKKFYPTEDLDDSITILRDEMAALKYELMLDSYKEKYFNGDKDIQVEKVGDEYYYYEKRDAIPNDYWDNYVEELYNEYARAKKDKSGVLEYESNFIFTPKTDDYSFFQTFNSVVKVEDGKVKVKRISSDKNGYDFEEYKEYFDYGYNTHVLKRNIK